MRSLTQRERAVADLLVHAANTGNLGVMACEDESGKDIAVVVVRDTSDPRGVIVLPMAVVLTDEESAKVVPHGNPEPLKVDTINGVIDVLSTRPLEEGETDGTR